MSTISKYILHRVFTAGIVYILKRKNEMKIYTQSDYDEDMSSALAAYEEALAHADAACDEATAHAGAAYREATALARAAYDEDMTQEDSK